MVGYRNLAYEIRDAIATITIDRPDKLNALDTETIEELGVVVRSVLEDDSVAGALITGRGSKAFVAGADIAELSRLGPHEAVELSRRGQRTFRDIELSPKPFVAVVNGFALGGGCELALACHLRVAARGASFGFPEVRLGIIPGYGGTVRLPRLIGSGRAMEMILTGESIDAEEAHRIGLVNRIAGDGEALEAAEKLLRVILSNGPLAIASGLESVVRGGEAGIEEALVIESTLFGLLASTEDMREGMNAFLARRPPEFRGH